MAYHKPSTLSFEVKLNETINCRPLGVEDMPGCANVLLEKDNAFSPAIYDYFSKGYLGFGAFNGTQMVGYVFIKNPATRPETLSVVKKKWRDLGIASTLRVFAIEQSRKELVGEYVYSATELGNVASLVSLLNSGYEITEITDKKHIQLRKKLPTVKSTVIKNEPTTATS